MNFTVHFKLKYNIRGSAAGTVQKLGDDRSCSVKRVADYRPRAQRTIGALWICFLSREEKRKMGRISGVANSEIKHKADGVKKETLLKERKNIVVGKLKKSPNGITILPRTQVSKFVTWIHI